MSRTLLNISRLSFTLAVICGLLGFAWPSWRELWVWITTANHDLFKVGFVLFIVLFLTTLVASILTHEPE